MSKALKNKKSVREYYENQIEQQAERLLQQNRVGISSAVFMLVMPFISLIPGLVPGILLSFVLGLIGMAAGFDVPNEAMFWLMSASALITFAYILWGSIEQISQLINPTTRSNEEHSVQNDDYLDIVGDKGVYANEHTRRAIIKGIQIEQSIAANLKD